LNPVHEGEYKPRDLVNVASKWRLKIRKHTLFIEDIALVAPFMAPATAVFAYIACRHVQSLP